VEGLPALSGVREAIVTGDISSTVATEVAGLQDDGSLLVLTVVP
jgi:hypothetical protein